MITKKLSAALLFCFCFALFLFPAPLSSGLREGYTLLTSIALPALFPYMIIASVVRRSGCIDPFTRFLSPAFTRVFGIEKNGVLPVMIALLAGYPLGVSITCSLKNEGKISKDCAERLLFFCANPSPAFLIAGVGVGLFHHAASGILLYVTLTLSALLVGILQNIFLSKNTPIPTLPSPPISTPPLFSVLVSSVRECVQSMAYIGGFLLFFSSLSHLLSLLPVSHTAKMLFCGLLEVIGGIFSLPATAAYLPLAAFLCGFGGLCVTAQSAVFIESSRLSLTRYLYGRILIALLAAAFTGIFLKIST